MIIILCAPSGSGKSTMVKHLLETYPGQYELSISATTRAPRGQEQHGKEYYFISKEEFDKFQNDQDAVDYTGKVFTSEQDNISEMRKYEYVHIIFFLSGRALYQEVREGSDRTPLPQAYHQGRYFRFH